LKASNELFPLVHFRVFVLLVYVPFAGGVPAFEAFAAVPVQPEKARLEGLPKSVVQDTVSGVTADATPAGMATAASDADPARAQIKSRVGS